jgi:hypothetical protein
MLGRVARDDPWFFTQIDSAIYGDDDVLSDLSPLAARISILRQYADYCTRQEVLDRSLSHALLLRPMNQIFRGMEQEKILFGNLLRESTAVHDTDLQNSTPRSSQTYMFGEKVHTVLDRLEQGLVTPTAAARRANFQTQQQQKQQQQQQQRQPRNRGVNKKPRHQRKKTYN